MSSSSPSSTSPADAKSLFNIKVLRRHDPLITSILHSFSFIVLYQYSTAASSWAKTGIEGPMFLYERKGQSPAYGMFVLNRNGVENFDVKLRGASETEELEVTDEFVILRTEEETMGLERDEEEGEEESIIGVWVFEKDQRRIVGEELTRLQDLAARQPTAPAAAASVPATISLDSLFGSASSSSNIAAHSSSTQTPNSSGGPALLDQIFHSATAKSSSPAPAPRLAAGSHPQPMPDARGQPVSPPAHHPGPSLYQVPPESKPTSPSTASDSAAGLMAMLGLGPAVQKQPEPSPPPPPPPASNGSALPGIPSSLQALFSSATGSQTNGQHTGSPKASSEPKAAEVQPSAEPPSARDAALYNLDESMRLRDEVGTGLSKSEYIREILSLIHTDKAFAEGLYQRYRSR